MTRGGMIGLSVVGVGAVALLVTWFLVSFERKDIDVPLPPRGEAVFNPLYALKVSLQGAGQRVVSRPRLADETRPLGPRDTVVLNGDPDLLSQRDINRLFDWVAEGGHLVVEAPSRIVPEDQASLVAWFGVRPREATTEGCLTVDKLPTTIPDKDADAEWIENRKALEKKTGKPAIYQYDMYCWSRFTLIPEAKPQLAWRDGEGAVFARFEHGDGSIDVVADILPLSRKSLQEREHAAFVRQLLDPNWGRGGTFHLIYSTDMPPLWQLLWRHGWMAIVSLALLLLMWVRMRTPRFGPLLPSPPEVRRSLLEHVQASGEHLYRYGRAHLLHAALRRHVLARIRRRDPVAASLEGQAQITAIAERTGLPATDVADALHSPRPLDARDFRHRIARLISLGRNA
ncbi:MAG: DUF4350 domain-containing protein [Lysobacter sp.]|nr:DUF4350 domain-containing protein [Lysobacter sp.]